MRTIFTIFIIAFSSFIFGQTTYADSVQTIRNQQTTDLLNEDSKSLNEEERNKIASLDYYPIQLENKVKATFIKKKGKEFQLPTSSGSTKTYIKYGYLTFDWKGEIVTLVVYQDVNLSKRKGFENYLIIPFKDLTSAKETYGGGRYLDFKVPNSQTVEIDFNLAYNPYCAYSYRYNCPIPPEENHLKVTVEAGEKTPIEK